MRPSSLVGLTGSLQSLVPAERGPGRLGRAGRAGPGPFVVMAPARSGGRSRGAVEAGSFVVPPTWRAVNNASEIDRG
jgi:hypothetical protein